MSIKRLWTVGLVALLAGVGVLRGPEAFAASNVSNVTFNGSSLVGGATADWTIGFKTGTGNGSALTAGSTITVTFNGGFSEPNSPVVTLSGGFSGCTASSIAADGPSSGADVVTVTLAGAGCALAKNTAGALKLAGLTNAPVGTYSANNFTVSTSSDTNQVSAPSAITLTAGSASKLAFVQGPSDGFVGTPLSPAITVQVQDQVGNAVSGSGTTVTLTPSTGAITSGATATTDASGKATFSSVVINATALGITLTASANGLTSTAASAAFNVTVAVSSGAALTDTASDGGSGVKSVAYYYCTGYSGSCTSANWTLIGSSTSAATNYQVSWTGQPANGAYRVVAIGTDNVTNVSQPSNSTPVSVTN
ncbi:MAG TPA: hypothetical protein VGL05_01115 [Kribbella sp.]